MKQNKTPPVLPAITLGILSGMRTTAGPAIASHLLKGRNNGFLARSWLDFLQSGTTAAILKVMAAGELVADKLPATGNRIEPAGIVGRCLAGGLAGAGIYKASGNSALKGAALGAIMALGSTYASFYLRKNVVEATHMFDPLCGAAEDAVVLLAGIALNQEVNHKK